MRLSEAMMLGATTNKLFSSSWDYCLLGVSVKAMGCVENKFNREAEERWPWILQMFTVPEISRKHYPHITSATGVAIISNLASWVEEGEMTLEQAVDWVRSVEPEEDDSVNEVSTDMSSRTVEVQS